MLYMVEAETHRFIQGMGAMSAVAAQAAEQVPRAALQASIVTGTRGLATTVPNWKPAAA